MDANVPVFRDSGNPSLVATALSHSPLPGAAPTDAPAPAARTVIPSASTATFDSDTAMDAIVAQTNLCHCHPSCTCDTLCALNTPKLIPASSSAAITPPITDTDMLAALAHPSAPSTATVTAPSASTSASPASDSTVAATLTQASPSGSPPQFPAAAPPPSETAHASPQPPAASEGKRKRPASAPPSPPGLPPMEHVASQLSAVIASVAQIVSALRSDGDDAAPLTRGQAASVLDAVASAMLSVLESVRTLNELTTAPPRTPAPVPTRSSTPASATAHVRPPTSNSDPLVPPRPTSPSLTTPCTTRPTSHSPSTSIPTPTPTPASAFALPSYARGMSYADRLRSEHRVADGASRKRLASRILVAPPPMQRRLVPLTREPQARLAAEVAVVRVVYARGLLRMPFRELRGYLRELSAALTPRSIPSISFFGPITSFTCVDAATASELTAVLTAAGGRVDPNFCPWAPLRRDQQDDAGAKQRAEIAFCKRIAAEITSTPNLMLATFLQRHLAPHLAPAISALVRDSLPGPARPTPHRSQPAAPEVDTRSTQPSSTNTCPTSSAAQPSPAAPAVSTSAPAAAGVVAEGTA